MAVSYHGNPPPSTKISMSKLERLSQLKESLSRVDANLGLHALDFKPEPFRKPEPDPLPVSLEEQLTCAAVADSFGDSEDDDLSDQTIQFP